MRRLTQRSGNVLVVVATAMVALLGSAATVVDVGQGYAAQARQQAAADAGALAAARHLAPPANEAAARQAAAAWVAKNGYTISPGDVSIWNHPNGQKAVTVRCLNSVSTLFARIFGINQLPVSVSSTATLAGVAEMPTGWLPLSVPAYRETSGAPPADDQPSGGPNDWFVKSTPDGDYRLLTADPSKGGPTRLVLKDTEGQGGNYQALAIGGSGASTYRNNLINGCELSLDLPTVVTTKPGNMAGPTAQGLAMRIATMGEAGRMILVPLVDRASWGNGRTEVNVIGYASARLDTVDPWSGQITATFISRVLSAKADRQAATNSPGVYAPLFVPTP